MIRRLGFAMVVLLAGCSSPPPDEMFAEAMQREELARQAADTVADAGRRAELFGDAVSAYNDLLDAHPESSQAEQAVFRLATIYNNDVRDFPMAVETYRAYVTQFPEGDKAAVAMFLIGYVYHNELQMLDSAKAAYERFLSAYPNHEMAVSAQFELNTLGKPAEELVPADDAPEVASGKQGG